MAKFKVVKTIDLAFLGEGWNECYLKVNELSWDEITNMGNTYGIGEFTREELLADMKKAKKSNEKMTKFVESQFVSGKGFDGKSVIDITKEDVKELPGSVIIKAIEIITGQDITNPKE